MSSSYSIRSIGVRELKNNLSAYLRDVARNIRILVTDRHQVVAELGKPLASHKEFSPLEESWVSSGKMRLPLTSKKNLSSTLVKLPQGTAEFLIDSDRGD